MPKKLSVLLMPLLVITVCLYAGVYMYLAPAVWLTVLLYLPFALVVVLVLLAWHFNKGRLLIISFLLGIPLYQLFFSLEGSLSLGYLMVVILNLSIVSLIQERGFFNRFAINRIAFIGMLFAWCIAFEKGWISFFFLNEAVLEGQHYTWSSVLLILIIVGCLLSGIIHWWQSANALCTSIFITQVALLIVFYIVNVKEQASLLMSGTLLIWVLYLLIESHKMAYIDDLTQINSRRALNEKLLALPKNYIVVMADIDHFKKFNDTYGHDMGDSVLYRVAQELAKVEQGGKVFRYGGEEFTILFFNKQWSDIEDSLEHLRESVQNMKVSVFDVKKGTQKNVQVTVSMGACESQSSTDSEQIFKFADDALYKAKRNGRNRIELKK